VSYLFHTEREDHLLRCFPRLTLKGGELPVPRWDWRLTLKVVNYLSQPPAIIHFRPFSVLVSLSKVVSYLFQSLS
jgi:hypothetical protein